MLTNEDKERLLHLAEISKTNTLREFSRWLIARLTLEEAQAGLKGMYNKNGQK